MLFWDVKLLQACLQTGSILVNLQEILGKERFARLFHAIKRILFVAKKLACPSYCKINKKSKKNGFKCFCLLSQFKCSQHDWDVKEFLQALEQIDQELAEIFLRIVAGVMHHPIFSGCIEEPRRNCREKDGLEVLKPSRKSRQPEVTTVFATLRVINSLGLLVNSSLLD